MKIIEQLPSSHPRHLRHTFVQGQDQRHYKILTHQLYDRTPPPEFHNFEVNVQEVDERGKFKELNVPYFRRYFSREDALAHHQYLLEHFDEALALEAPRDHAKKEKEKEEPAH